MQLTTSEFADLHGVDYATAAGTLRFLQQKGKVKSAGSRPAKGGKGKPSTVYDVPNEVTVQLVKEETAPAPVQLTAPKTESPAA